MSLTKCAFNAIQKALHNLSFNPTLTDTWVQIHNELGVGTISNKKLILTSADHEKLRTWARLESGADPLTTVVSGDRLQTSTFVRNEKWASESVFAGMMQVNRISGSISLAHGEATTPAGTLLFVAAADIQINELSTVVVVENGIIARYWHKCQIPSELMTALMVYRGHSQDADTVRKWLAGLPSHVRKVGYFDFDPAGLGLAFDYGVSDILIPFPLSDDLLAGINNKSKSHVEQLLRRPDLRNQLSSSARDIFDWMTAAGRKCAITQERLLSMDYPLQLILFTQD